MTIQEKADYILKNCPNGFRFSKAEKIVDVKIFVESHMNVINSGARIKESYIERIELVYEMLKNIIY